MPCNTCQCTREGYDASPIPQNMPFHSPVGCNNNSSRYEPRTEYDQWVQKMNCGCCCHPKQMPYSLEGYCVNPQHEPWRYDAYSPFTGSRRYG